MTVVMTALAGWLLLNAAVVLGVWYLRSTTPAPPAAPGRWLADVPGPRASSEAVEPVTAAGR